MKHYFNDLKIFFYSGYDLIGDNMNDSYKKTILFGIDTSELLKKVFKKDQLIIGDIFIDTSEENLFIINLIENINELNQLSFEGIDVLVINIKDDNKERKLLNEISLIDVERNLSYLGNILLYKSIIEFIQNNKLIKTKRLVFEKLSPVYASLKNKKNKLSIYTVNNEKEKKLCSYKINHIERLFIKDFHKIHNLINSYGYSLLVKMDSKDGNELSLLTDSLLVNKGNVSFIGINEFGLPSLYKESIEEIEIEIEKVEGYGELHHYLDSYSKSESNIYKKYLLMCIS